MSKKSYAQIQKQIEVLQRQADELRSQEVAGVVARIKEAIAHYGLTAQQLGYGGGSLRAKAKGPKAAGGAVVPAYSDGLGNTWGGRGPRPQWLKAAVAAGKTPEDFASPAGAAAAKAQKPVKPKASKKRSPSKAYRDQAGNAWAGRGPRPQWLKDALAAGQTLEQLAA